MLPLPTFLVGFLQMINKYETLQHGLKHGTAIKPKDNEILALAEDIYDQINRKGLCRENHISIQHFKNSF